MMDRDDPLEMWLIQSEYQLPPNELAEHQARIHHDLDQLEAWLDDTSAPKRGKMPFVRGGRWSGGIPPMPKDIERVKVLHRRVFVTVGSGKRYVEEALLWLLAATKDPAHIPFWSETLDLSRPRDSLANTRRAAALSALALIAIRREDADAYAALRSAAHHDNPQVRELAIYYLGRAYQGYWDDDHLYAFFMNGKLYDERYQFASPWDRDAEAWVDQAVIGELGLTPKHKFLYYFDYGDGHQFEVEVVDIKAHAGRGKYPRVIESQGKAPAQYWYGEEDEEGEDEDEDGV